MSLETVIYIHLGKNPIPEYLWTSVRQTLRFSPVDTRIVVVSNPTNVIPQDLKQKITAINVMAFRNNEHHARYQNINKLRDKGEFWSVTLERLFILETTMKALKISRCLHIENDILLYTDANDLIKRIAPLYGNHVAGNVIGPRHFNAAVLYVGSVQALHAINVALLDLLNLPPNVLQVRLGNEFCSEMTLLRNLFDDGRLPLKTLPMFPEGDFSQHVDALGIIDGASWGQYVGGTPGDETTGKTFPLQYLGPWKILDKYKFAWVADDQGRKVPILERDGRTMRICNLHIHSKNLARWVDGGE